MDESDDDAASSWEEFWLPRVDAVVEDWPVNGTGIMEDTERVEKGENNGPLKVFIEPRPADYKFQHNNEDYDVVLLSNQPGNKMAKDGSSLYDLSAHLLENNNKGNTNKAHSLSSSSSSQKPAIIASYSSLKSHVNHNKMIPFNLIANAYRDPTDFISRIHDTYTIPSAHAPHYSKKTAGIMIAFLPDCSKLPPAHIAYIKALKQVLDEIAGKGGGVGGGGGIGLFIHSGCLSKGNQPATPSMPDDKRIKLVAGYKFVLVWDARMGDVGRGYVSEAYFRALAYDAVVVVLGSDEDIVRPVMISTEQTIRVTTTTTNGGGHDNDNDDVVLVIDPTGVYNRKPEALGRKIWSIASSQDAWEGMMQWKRIQSTRKSSSSSSSHMSQGGEAVAADINPSPQFRRLWKQSIESLVCRICDQVLLHSGAYGDGDHLEEDRKEFYPFDMDEYLESNE